MAEDREPIPEALAPDADAKDRSIIEALLTAADQPVSGPRIAEMLREGVGAKQVKGHIDALNEDYVRTGRAFRITEVAGGYQFTVHPEFAPWIRTLLDEKAPTRLSQAALESLAIIAFKQPITKAELEHIRGVNVDGVLRHLMEKGLVRIAGRSEGVGRPLLYGTARDFLKFFGLNSLSDLPKLREIEEMMKDEDALKGGLRSMAEAAGDEEREVAGQTPEGKAPAKDASGEGGEDPTLIDDDGRTGGEQDGPGKTEPLSGADGDRVEENV